jgi:hypothetical protein
LDRQILVDQLHQVRQLGLLLHHYQLDQQLLDRLWVLLRLVVQLHQVRHLRQLGLLLHHYQLDQQLLDRLWVLLRLVVQLHQVRHLRQLDQQLLEVQYLL